MSSVKSHHRTVVGDRPQIILNNQGQVLPPLQLTADRHILGRDPNRADLIVPGDWVVLSSHHAILERRGQNYFIYDGDGINPSKNGLFINHTRITHTQGYCLQDGDELKIGQNPTNFITLTYYSSSFQPSTAQSLQKSISLNKNLTTIGRESGIDLTLDSPIVSRRHAVVTIDKSGQYIIKDYSTNGTFVNGQRVNDSLVLPPGASIRIGPYLLLLQGDRLVIGDKGDRIRLDAYQLVREVKDKGGKKKILLDDISLPIEPGQLVALVGGSGAGKSTLMRTLLGVDPTTTGEVFLNGESLRTNFNIYRTQIGYVPQDDIVHRDLTVEEVLTYAAKLRLPPDTNIEEAIAKTLEEIKMSHHRQTLVGKLSGGQRKRISIGVELLADPKLFFLDEPTSGLDPGLDKKMMELLRDLADRGRTIILVTHATSNINLCDRIVFLGLGTQRRGGKLCYFGTPQEILKFFQDNCFSEIKDLSDIYNHLIEEDHVDRAKYQFKNSDFYTQYITDRLSIESRADLEKPPKQNKQSSLQQLILFSRRYFQLLIRDRVNLGLALLTAPIGIILITLALGEKNPLILGAEDDPTLAPLALRVLFVFTCAAIWVGLSTSLQEIVKETAIYMRERLVNLRLFSYLGSKLGVLGGLALSQTLLMAIAILVCFQSPEPELIPWSLGIGITTFLTLLTCTNLGLMISALVENSAQANSALPLLLLPQIIFSGVLFKMEGIGQYISWFMLSRWSVGAYGALVDVNNMIPEPTQLPDGSIVSQPFEATSVYDPTWENLALNWGILFLHAAIYFGVTWWKQKSKDVL
ncbi:MULTISPECIES: FHA domain-containing protein [Spirulina sp. CCY15215]|uniref:FHA domain-containing protein n=1 Tax=Spirulina sp. CCY15215 TaxID=2767591 RepID=UPI0019528EF2|nr:FHA domain-containing protein [Spirulina major]